MSNFAIRFKNTAGKVAGYATNSTRRSTLCRTTIPSTSFHENTVVVSERTARVCNSIKTQWNKFKNYINSLKNNISPNKLTNNIQKHSNDDVAGVVEETIGNKPYKIATAGYSLETDGYEEVTKSFLESIDKSLGYENTSYVFPPNLDKGSIYDITAQISGLGKSKSLFFTAEEFYNIKPEGFSPNIDIKEYSKIPVHIFPTPEIYTRATANASNVLVCTGGRSIAVDEIAEAIKRKHKVVLLHNLNLSNGTYNSTTQGVENAARYFDELRLSDALKCSQLEKEKLEELLKNEDEINKLVRVYLVNDEKSAIEAGERAAKFIKNTDLEVVSDTILPNIEEVKTMSEKQLKELTDILKKIPQKMLKSKASEHIHKIKWSTINPEVGVVVTQNPSKPIIARKIITDGTLENSIIVNNSHNIHLKYDIVKETQYIETPYGRQALTGDGFMAVYAKPVKAGHIEDHSFIPADIAANQYEIITQSGKHIPCNYNNMSAGVDYKIIKKAGVKLKMAVPPREVISSEGEILSAGKLYMVDSKGHFYDGNPILRIKNGDIDCDMPAHIRTLIDESLELERKANTVTKAGNKELSNKLIKKSEQLTTQAEQEMTNWVKSIQNKKDLAFFI